MTAPVALVCGFLTAVVGGVMRTHAGSMDVDTPGTDQGPAPTRWKRAGAIAGLIASVLLVVTLLLLLSLPSADSPARSVAAHLRARYAVTVAASYAGLLTSAVLIPFTASLNAFARGPDGDSEWRWTVTLLSTAAAVSLLLVGSTLLGAADVLARQNAGHNGFGGGERVVR